MNIVILDDYQDAVRKLQCASKLEAYPAKVYTNTVKGIGQLSVRLRDADVIVLIRERTQITRQLLEKLALCNDDGISHVLGAVGCQCRGRTHRTGEDDRLGRGEHLLQEERRLLERVGSVGDHDAADVVLCQPMCTPRRERVPHLVRHVLAVKLRHLFGHERLATQRCDGADQLLYAQLRSLITEVVSGRGGGTRNGSTRAQDNDRST